MANAPKRILIVDDELESLHTIRVGLSLKGYTVTTRGNAAEALAEMRESVSEDRAYDLLVLDVEMPAMSGDELLRVLVAEGISLPPVFIMTGYDDDSLTKRLEGLRCAGIVHKPMTIHALEELVSRTLGP